MSKSFRYTPDLRVRKPYKREPKLRTNVPVVPPFPILEEEDTEVDEFEYRDPYEADED